MRALATLALLVLAACPTPGTGGPSTVDVAMDTIRLAGDVALRARGYAALEKYAPDVIVLVDLNDDKVITFAELEAFVATVQDPNQIAWLLLVAYALTEGE